MVPVVPGQSVLQVHFPVVPAVRVFSARRWSAGLGGGGSTAVLAGSTGSTRSSGPFPGSTGPAGFAVWRWWEVLCRAVVPPFGPVLPALVGKGL